MSRGSLGNSPVDFGIEPLISAALPLVGEFFGLIVRAWMLLPRRSVDGTRMGLYLILLALLLGVSFQLAARMVRAVAR